MYDCHKHPTCKKQEATMFHVSYLHRAVLPFLQNNLSLLLSFFVRLNLTSSLTISSHSSSLTVILCHPAGSQACSNLILLSNSFQTPSPPPVTTRRPPHQPRPVGRTPAVFIRKRDDSIRKEWMEKDIRKHTRKIQSHTKVYIEDAAYSRMVEN